MIIGIDPGVSGGICCFSKLSRNYALTAMPKTEGDIFRYIKAISDKAISQSEIVDVVIEDIPHFCGVAVPSSSAAVLFENFGFVKGVAMALELPLYLYAPKEWQKPLCLGKKSDCASPSEWKNKLKAEAQRRYPYIDPVTLKTADAILIMDYHLGKTLRNNEAQN